MSRLGLITGEPQTRPCIRCSRPVGHQRISYSTGNGGTAHLWSATSHRTTCGVVCGVGHPPDCTRCTAIRNQGEQ